MSNANHDAGVLAVLVERFNSQRLPRALDLKAKVEKGETLDELDLDFLKAVFADANRIHAFAEKHPEYQELYARGIHLYKEILDKAMENEKRNG